MLYARRFASLESDASISNIIEPRDLANIDLYDTKLLLENLWEYTLVLPALLEESDFSRRVHNVLMFSVRSVGKSDGEKAIT